ncbi:MAG: putative baseplate assembly protein [Bryobacteraceae bacterium]
MIAKPQIEPDRRDARQILEAVLARRLGYTPQWLAPEKSAGHALAAVCARYLEAVVQRLNQAPAKNKLAFLDLAGLGPIATQAARAPIVFQLSAQSAGGSAPAHTPVAAPPAPGGSQQILFETEQAAGVTAGKLMQLFSLWPGRDEYIDHSEDFLAGKPVQPFSTELRKPTPHQLYLSHPVLLALAGNVELAVEFEVATPSSNALEIVWEYWDGTVWRGFLSSSPECGSQSDDLDSTDGLSQSGHYILRADCAQAGKTKVNGVEGFWLRGRLADPLPPDPGEALPQVDSVRIASSVDRALQGRLRVAEPRVSKTKAIVFSSVASLPAAPSLEGIVSNEAGQPVKGAVVQLIDPAQPGQPAHTSPQTDDAGFYSIPNVDFTRPYRYNVTFAGIRFSGPDATLMPKESPSQTKSAVDMAIAVEGLTPDKAFADGTALDVSKPFYALGQQPQPGTAFYFSNEEAFAKPGAKVRIYLARTLSPQDQGGISGSPEELTHKLEWEYWNGRQWAPLAVRSNFADSRIDLDRTEVIEFTVPIDLVAVSVNGEEALWVRARLQSGTYGFRQEVKFNTGEVVINGGSGGSRFTYLVTQPPVLASFQIGYTWQYGPFSPEQVIAYNDFTYRDHTQEAIWPGTTFLPFERVSDVTPVLYMGFDKKPPADQLGIFFDVEEVWGEPAGPVLVWEHWDGFAWRRLTARDETGNLRRPGIVNVLAQAGDAALARFGTSLYWIRGRLEEDGPPGQPVFSGIYPNAVWATERRTMRDLPVGTSNGTPNQAFSVPHTPILGGDQIEVRELNGARANVEWRILAMEIFSGSLEAVRDLELLLSREGTGPDVTRGVLRLRRNRQKQVTEVWVRWENREHLFFSAAGDRHYALDRALGRLHFGDGTTGRVPPAGAAILIREISSGGGSGGNVAARAITQLLGVIPGIEAVFNPRAAEGGADGEMPEAILDRGPRTIRHRGRAIDAGGYETLVMEASPAVAIARAVPGRHPSGALRPGWVTLLIVPRSEDARPYPSFALREHVRRFLEERAPADLAALHRIQVTGPVYLPVDVSAIIAAVDPSESGTVERRARAALERFLHPLTGGPGGQGWDLGRDVYLSDMAAVLERTEGLDYVEELTLFRDGVPQGESLPVDDTEIVAAGAITFLLRESRP